MTTPFSLSSTSQARRGCPPGSRVGRAWLPAALLLLGLPLAGRAQFATKVDFPVGSDPQSVATADINGDGRPDFLTANTTYSNVSVLLNTTATGSTIPTFATGVDFTTSSPQSVVTADVNGDGKPDLLTANSLGNSASVQLNTTATGATTPVFATAVNFAAGNGTYGIAAADVNGDGKPDLITANYNSNNVSVLLNTTATGATTPTFATAANFTVGSNPRNVVAADVNGDGKSDLLAVNNTSNSVSVLLNTMATGATVSAFATKVDFAVGTTPRSVAVADINGDSKPDLLTANLGSNNASVRLNTTTTGATVPTFAAVATFMVGSGPLAVAAADVNGDGKPDLLTANYSTSNASILLNTTAIGATTPTFATKTDYTTGSSPRSLVLADVNSDSKPDLLVANNDSDINAYTVSVLLSQYAAPAPTLTTLSPTSGPVGTSVTLTGTGFSSASTVSFNGTAATVTYVSATQLTAVVPTGATTGNVTVTTGSNGTSSGVSFTVTAAPTVTTAAATTITSTTATLGGNVTADGGSTITERGVVYSSSNAVPTVANAKLTASGTTGSFTASATGLTASTTYYVRAYATNSVGTSYGAAVSFATTAAAPSVTVTSLNPTGGPVGTLVVIGGTGFTTASTVSFNGTAATSVTYVSAGQLNVTVPAGATSGNVTVTTGGSTSATSSASVFTVYPDLVISTGSAASPVSIAAGTYNTITVTGSGYAQLAGNVITSGAFTVNGSLNTNCFTTSGNGSASTFTLAAGATLYICDAAGLGGAFASTGVVQGFSNVSYSPDATYLYNGTAAQVTGTGLPAQVRNLTTTNANAVTLSAATSVAQVLTVAGAGNFVTNSQALILRSSASGTALLVNSGTGTVSGSLTVQRYLDGSQNTGLGYRQLAAPVAGQTVNSFASGGTALTVNSAYNTSATPLAEQPFPTVFGYDQSRLASATNNLTGFDKGWYSPAATSDAAAVGTGYTIQLPGSSTLSFSGAATQSSATLSASRGAGSDAGLALVGNPYAAPLDLSSIATTQRSNVDAAFYVFESSGQYAGGYRSVVNNVGTSTLLGSSQAFFMRVSSGSASGTLSLTNANRVTSYGTQAPVRRTTAETRPLVQLTLAGAGLADEFFAYAESGATAGYDSEFDAAKLPNSHGLNLSSTAAAGERLAIDGRPAFTAATVLPLAVGVPAAGTYTLTAAQLLNLPAGRTATLHDLQTGMATVLAAGTSYSFSVTAAQAASLLTGRFTLSFGGAAPLATAPAALAAQVLVYPNPAREQATVALPGVAGAATVQVELLNALGQLVRRQQAALPAAGTSLVVPTAGLASGVYVLRLNAGAALVTKRLTIE